MPWKGAYSSAAHLGGDTEFVLSASGHIAGVVNPASKNKRSYWVGGSVDQGHEQWLQRRSR